MLREYNCTSRYTHKRVHNNGTGQLAQRTTEQAPHVSTSDVLFCLFICFGQSVYVTTQACCKAAPGVKVNESPLGAEFYGFSENFRWGYVSCGLPTSRKTVRAANHVRPHVKSTPPEALRCVIVTPLLACC